MDETVKTLDDALAILVDAHTRDNDFSGFVVEMGAARIYYSHHDYIDAWRIVRAHLGRKTEPR